MEKRKGNVLPAVDLDAISGAVERSVSETLSSQLNVMFTGSRNGSVRDHDAAQADTDRTTFIHSRLSKRQTQVLRLLGEGKTNKEMAKALFLSPNTIKLHVSAILQRLKLGSRTHAALLSSRLSKQGSTELTGSDLNSWKKVRTQTQHLRARRTIRARASNRPFRKMGG